MTPKEVMRCSIPELLSFIDGYYNRLRASYEQARMIAYMTYAANTDQNKREEIEDFWPLWFDPSPEDRRRMNEVNGIKQGMVAAKDIEHYRSLGINI